MTSVDDKTKLLAERMGEVKSLRETLSALPKEVYKGQFEAMARHIASMEQAGLLKKE